MNDGSVDTRVVELQFNNKQFEKNVEQSVKTLDTLKKSLKLDDAAKGLEDVSKAAKKIDMTTVVNSIDKMNQKLSIGHNLLSHFATLIEDKVIGSIRKLSSFLGVKSGFAEYETQIRSVQTILSNTKDKLKAQGIELESDQIAIVNEKLDELNYYADKTIYSFTEMTSNIGRFTAAGVGLDDSVSSIKGISNLAALSGSTSQQASMAMYQLSQAIASGTVKMLDWNSVVTAGMGGEVFQKALIRTAGAMGVVGDEAKTAFDKLQKGQAKFRDTLHSGWLTSDILTETLSQIAFDPEVFMKERGLASVEEALALYRKELIEGLHYTEEEADAIIDLANNATDAATKVKTFSQLIDTLKEALQSGWSQTWRLIVGDFSEAKDLFTWLSDNFGGIIQESSDARNKVVQEWADAGGRSDLIQGIKDLILGVENIVSAVKGAIEEVFPPVTGQRLAEISEGFKGVAQRFREFTEDPEKMGKLKNFIGGIASAIKWVGDTIKSVWGWITGLFKTSDDGSLGILDHLSNIGTWLQDIFKSISESEWIKSFLDTIKKTWADLSKTFQGFGDSASKLFDKIKKKIKESGILSAISMMNFGDKINEFISGIPGVLKKIKEFISGIVDYVKSSEKLQAAWGVVKNVYQNISSGLKEFWNKIKGAYETAFGDDSAALSVGERISLFFSLLKDIIITEVKKFTDPLVEKITGFVKTIPEKLKSAFNDLQPGNILQSFLDLLIPTAQAEETGDFGPMFVEGYDSVSTDITGAVDTVTTDITEAVETSGNNLTSKWDLVTQPLTTFFTETIPKFFEDIKTFVQPAIDKIKEVDWGTVLDAGKSLAGIYALFSLGKGLKTTSKSFMSTGEGLKEMFLGMKDMFTGIGKVGNFFPKLNESIDTFVKNKFLQSQTRPKDSIGNMLLKIAGSIGILVAAIYVLSRMDEKQIIKGLGIIGLVALEMMGISLVFKKINVDGKQFLSMSGALALLIIPLTVLGMMNPLTIMRGIVFIGVAITELAIANRLAGKGFKGKPGFASMAAAVTLLIIPIKALGRMNVGNALKGVIFLGIIMLELSTTMRIAGQTAKGNKNKNVVGLAVAVGIFTAVVHNLGNMPVGKAIKGLLGLTAIVLEISLLAHVMTGVNFKGIFTMSLGVAVLTIVMKSIGEMPVKKIAKGLLGLGGIMISLGFLLKFAGGMTTPAALGSVFIIATMLAALFGAFNLMSQLPTAVVATIALSISAIVMALGKMVAGIAALSRVPFAGMMKALGGIAIFLVGFGALVAGIGALIIYVPEIKQFISAGKGVFLDLGLALGEFIGGFVGGALAGLSAGLPAVGTNLSDFSTNVGGFITNSKTWDSSIVEKVGYMTQALLKISGAEFVKGIVDWITQKDSVDEFAKSIPKLGFALKLFQLSVAGIGSSSDITTATTAASGLSDLVKAVPWETPEWAKAIVGYKNVKAFADDVNGEGGLADTLKAYAEKMSGFTKTISDADMKAANSCATGLAQLENSLQAEGGILQSITGVPDLSSFATDLPIFAAGLKIYATQMSGFKKTISDADVKAANSCATGLVQLENSLTAEGGVLQGIIGVPDLSSFATDLPIFAKGLKRYAKYMSGFKSSLSEADQKAALEAAGALNDLQNKLPNTNGLVQWITGAKDLGDFAEDVKGIGKALKAFAEGAAGADDIPTDSALSVLTAVQTFTESLDESGSIFDFFKKAFGDGSKTNTLMEYINNMLAIGEGVHTFKEQVSDLGKNPQEMATSALNVVTEIKSFIDGLEATSVLGNWWNQFAGEGTKFETLNLYLDSMMTMGQRITQFKTEVSSLGNDTTGMASAATSVVKEIQGFIDGLEATSVLGNLWDTLVDGSKFTTLNSYLDSMVTMGQRITQFKTDMSGLGNDNSGMTAAATAVINEVQGFVDGLDASGSVLENIAKFFGGDKYNTLNTILGGIKNIGDSFVSFNSGMSGIDDAKTNFNTAKTVIEDIKGYIEGSTGWTNPGDVTIIQSVLDGFASLQYPEQNEGLTGAAEDMITALANHLQSESSKTSMKNAAKELSKAGQSGANSTYNDWEDVGEYLANGIGNGISYAARYIKTKASEAAQGAIETISIKWQINSPSKVGRGLGIYFDRGIAEGLSAYSKVVSSEAAGVGESAIASAKTMLTGVNTSIFDNLDPNPTIRPVVDLSNIQNGVNTINGMFGDRTISSSHLFSGRNARGSADRMNYDGVKLSGSMDSSAIVSQIQTLTEKLDSVTAAVGNMQLVMDSGALVGQITNKVDVGIGKNIMKKRRGI